MLLLVVELLVSRGLPSLVLPAWPLISAKQDKSHELKCIQGVCYLRVPYKIKDDSIDQLTGGEGG